MDIVQDKSYSLTDAWSHGDPSMPSAAALIPLVLNVRKKVLTNHFPFDNLISNA